MEELYVMKVAARKAKKSKKTLPRVAEEALLRETRSQEHIFSLNCVGQEGSWGVEPKMGDQSQIMDSVIATPRASSNGSIFWVTPTQYNPQTGTYQTHYYSDDLVKSGTVSVGTPTWKNNSVIPQAIPSSGINCKSVAAPVLIPPPQSRNLATFEDPVVKIPDGIKELEFEDDDDQSVVDIKQLNHNFEYDSENGDNSNRAKNVVDAVVALGHVLVKDLQRAVPNLKSGGSSIFESCLAGSNADISKDELSFSPKNILRDSMRNNVDVKPHLLPNGVTMQELIATGDSDSLTGSRNRKAITLSSSTLLSSELFFDQQKFPKLTLVSCEDSGTFSSGLRFQKDAIKRLNSDFGDSPLCFISFIDCPSQLFTDLLLNPNLESSPVHKTRRSDSSRAGEQDFGDKNTLVDLYYWYKDEQFIYLLLDFKISKIPKFHDVLLALANSISSTVVMNNLGVISQRSLNELSIIMDLQKRFEHRQERIINRLINESGSGNLVSRVDDARYSTPERKEAEEEKKGTQRGEEYKTVQENPLLLLTPRYKPSLRSETINDFKQSEGLHSESKVGHDTLRTLICTLKTTPRPCLIWLLHDFNYLLYDNSSNMILNSIDYFETLMTELGCGYECEESKIDHFENLKLYIRSFYAMKECYTLVSPFGGGDFGAEARIRMDHLKQVSCFRQRVLGMSRNHALNHKLGQFNSTLTVHRYLSIFFESLNGSVSSKSTTANEDIGELSELVQRRFCERILVDLDEYYSSENKKLSDALPMSEGVLMEEVTGIKSRCLHLYKEYTSTLIDTDIYIDYKIQLQNSLKAREEQTVRENSEVSVKYCTVYLNEISKKKVLSKLYGAARTNKGSFEEGASSIGSCGGAVGTVPGLSNKQYTILDFERDLDEIYSTMLSSLSEKIPKEILLNCFLNMANQLRHEWYQNSNDGGNKGVGQFDSAITGSKIGIENCFGGSGGMTGAGMNVSKLDDELVRKMETPEMLVSRLNTNLEEIDSEYNAYTLIQKKELLEDILLEATKKKDRMGDYYPGDQLYGLDCIISGVQERLDAVNTERKSILDNNEMQRQLLLKEKSKRWKRLFPCLKKKMDYSGSSLNARGSNNHNHSGQMSEVNVIVNSMNDSY
ncbi:hypothetical protein HWI79_1882 [Cryptosporidium felis]|nr:hypothetical protein HWI79_1882 [Cryptosporidium felis]